MLDAVPDQAMRHSYQAIIQDVLSGNTPYYTQEFAQKGPAEERVYQMRVNPMLINDRVTGLVFTNTDITEIKLTEAALRRRNEELLALNEIATLVSSSLDLSQILSTVVPKIRQLLDADVVAIYLTERDADILHLAEQSGLDDKTTQKVRTLDVRQSATGIAIERGQPLFVSDGVEEESPSKFESADLSATPQMRTFAALPLRSKEKILGALDVFYSKSKEFSRQDQQIMLLLANELGSAIENVLLYERISDQLKRLTVLFELSQKLTSSLELDEIARAVHAEIRSIIPFVSFVNEL